MADEEEWKRTKENGYAPDPKDVAALFRTAQAKISSGEATGAYILLCGPDGFVYFGEELPRSAAVVTDSILCLEYMASNLREEWENHMLVPHDRKKAGLEVVTKKDEDADNAP